MVVVSVTTSAAAATATAFASTAPPSSSSMASAVRQSPLRSRVAVAARVTAVAASQSSSVGSGGRDTGVFQKLPMVQPPDEHFNSAIKRARKLKGPPARHMDGLSAELTKPLKKYATEFPRLSTLHPFEAALVELTVGNDNYLRVMDGVDRLRKKTGQLGKAAAARVAAQKKTEMEKTREEEVEQLRATFCGKDGYRLTKLLETTRKLRRLPVVDLTSPTLALVGAPNVGKSSLVRTLSSGKPEVCNYPFTTRGISVGHIGKQPFRHQVTDTPGLLVRPDSDRNSMEKLTLAALQFLPTCGLYVIDPTGESGTSVADQILLHEELRQRFPDKPWLIAVSKWDLEMDEEAQDLLRITGEDGSMCEFDSIDDPSRTWQAIRCSVVDEQGTSFLKKSVFQLLELHRRFIEEQQQLHKESMDAQQKDGDGDDTTQVDTAAAIAGHALPLHPSTPPE